VWGGFVAVEGERRCGKGVGVLTALIQSVITRLPNSLSHMEEFMPRHVGVKGVY
jgi:hypothetical protein